MSRLRILAIVIATSLTSFLSSYLASSVTLSLRTIGNEFGTSPSNLSLVASVYLMCTSLCIVPFGNLSDRYGPKRTLVFGCAFFTVSNVVVPLLAFNFPILVVLRGLQGVGAALLLVSNTPIVSTVLPKANRTFALGLLSGLVYFGQSVGYFVGGVITDTLGWRAVFGTAAAASALALVAILFIVPPTPPSAEKVPRGLDVPGIFFYAMVLISLQSGANRINSVWGGALLVVCLVSFGLFIRRQMVAKSPVYDVRMFMANPVFAMANIAVFFSFAATYGSQYMLTLYLQCNRGMAPAEAGKIAMIQPFFQLFCSPLAGLLASRVSPDKVSSMGMGVIACALFMLSTLTDTTSLVMVYGALMMIGVGISLFSPPNTSIIMESVPPEKKGMAAASNSIMRNVGTQVSIIICGAFFLLYMGDAKGFQPQQYPALLSAIKKCYIIFAIMSSLGVLISLKRMKKDDVSADI